MLLLKSLPSNKLAWTINQFDNLSNKTEKGMLTFDMHNPLDLIGQRINGCVMVQGMDQDMGGTQLLFFYGLLMCQA